MKGFAPASLPRTFPALSLLACLLLLAPAISLHAASSSSSSSAKHTAWTSSVPAGLRTAVHRTLGSNPWAETQEVTEADPAFDPMFGYAVALHGTTAMIGAQQARIGSNDAQGAVYVFEEIDGVWTRTQKLVSDDGQAFDTFGHVIAFNDTTALIGAYSATVNDNYAQGAVYVFTRAAGTWTQTQKLSPSDGLAFDQFGYSIALNGTTALIGAYSASVNENYGQGAVYAFTRVDGVWSETQKIVASDGLAFDFCGYSLALSGTTVLVGCDGATVGAQDFQGKAVVFSQSTDGTWTQGQTLVASDGGIGDIFGYSVALEGTTAVIGAYGNNGYQGAAYVFGLSDGTWTQTQKLVAADGASNTYFGYATALSGSTLLVGAWGSNPGGVDTQGAAYIFTGSGGLWTQTQELTASDGGQGDKFGHSVALQGTTALIGADGWSASTAQGAVYEFDGSGGAFVQTQTLVASDGAPADQFGLPVTLDGDQALVGSWLWTSPQSTMPGSAYFFKRGSTATYTIGGHVSGLVGSGLALEQAGGDTLAISADGSFTFATPLADGASYSVSVSAQPGNPAQTCIVDNGSGTVDGTNVVDVAVSCSTNDVDRLFADGFDVAGGTGGPVTLAQTTDTAAVAQNSVACSNTSDGTTTENQYWRRYDFSEFAVNNAANVTSVDVSVQQTVGAPALTVTLYTTPHSVAVDTIDAGQLVQIGQSVVAAPADAALASINVPITGLVADTVGSDLVVEVSTEDGSTDGTVFYIGSTPSPETHPSFLSSESCGIPVPTPTADIGYPDMHIIQAVNLTH